MRTSKDIYKLADGRLKAFSQDEQPPEGATLWSGYDYQKQCWIFEGKKDERTLEQLQAARDAQDAGLGECKHDWRKMDDGVEWCTRCEATRDDDGGIIL